MKSTCTIPTLIAACLLLAASAAGPVTVDFVETSDNGPISLAETRTVLR